jgi:hypothetical protein
MQTTIENRNYAVYDRVLANWLTPMQDYARRIPLAFAHSRTYDRIWSFDDGMPVFGPPAYALVHRRRRSRASAVESRGRLYPTRTPIDLVLRRILRSASRFSPWVGEPGIDWVGISARLAIYPPNSCLSWHDDEAAYTGAFNMYVHPSWDFDWGGELMLLDGEPVPSRKRAIPEPERLCDPLRGRALAPEQYARSSGTFIVPVPNRLVVFRSGLCHQINRVRGAAGRVPRMAISGFFVRPGFGLENA